MRIKRVDIAADLIVRNLSQGAEIAACRVARGIPADARLIGVTVNPNPLEKFYEKSVRTVSLIFEHESFPETGRFDRADVIEVWIERESVAELEVGR